MRRLTCLVCPSGCQLVLTEEGVTGFHCPRGEKYAREEALTPRRALTATVAAEGALARLPVKTREKVALERIPELLRAIANIRVRPPVQLGEVIARLPEELVATRSLPLLAFLAFLSFAAPAQAWARHDLITRYGLAGVAWLERYQNITVTPYEYEDKSPYNPDWEVPYVAQKVGDKTTAREILIRYSDEPDWKMDEVQGLSPFQSLMGGGQGFRHQRYFFGPVRLGDAPNRAVHFYELSKQAFAKGDSYWGFRFFARTLHYLEDMAEPLHTQPATLLQARKLWFSIPKLTNFATNLHFAYERYVSRHMVRRDASGERFIKGLQEPERIDLLGIKDGAIALAEYSHGKASNLLEANEGFWPKRVKSKSKKVEATDAEIFPTSESWEQSRMDRITENCLKPLGKVMRGALEILRKEALEKPAPKPEDEE